MFGPRWKDNTENKRITFWDLNKVLIYFLLLFTLEAYKILIFCSHHQMSMIITCTRKIFHHILDNF